MPQLIGDNRDMFFTNLEKVTDGFYLIFHEWNNFEILNNKEHNEHRKCALLGLGHCCRKK